MGDWIKDLQITEQLANELMHKLHQRNEYSTTTSAFAKSDRVVRTLYKELADKISNLENNLLTLSSTNELTQRETARREKFLSELKNRSFQMNEMINNPNSDRRNLFGPRRYQSEDSYQRIQNVGWNDLDTEAGPSHSESNGQSVSELRQAQRILIDEQDRGLDQLGEIISRQKNIAHGINYEINVHNEIIDQITDNLQQTDERLTRNTRNIRRIDKKTNTCCYWIVIVLLFIAILVAAFV